MDVDWAKLPKDMLLKVCTSLHGDGHTVWKPEKLLRLGVPSEYVESVATEHESDGSHKGSIFTSDGDMLVSTYGVYGLTVYRTIGHALGLASSTKSGRGFEAQDWNHRIREHLTNS